MIRSKAAGIHLRARDAVLHVHCSTLTACCIFCSSSRTSPGCLPALPAASGDSSSCSAVVRVRRDGTGSMPRGPPTVTALGWCVIAVVNERLEDSGAGTPIRVVLRTSTDGRAGVALSGPSLWASLCEHTGC